MSLSGTICKAAILALLLNVAIGYAAADECSLLNVAIGFETIGNRSFLVIDYTAANNRSSAKELELKTRLFNTHTTMESFVRGKMEAKLERLCSELAGLKEEEELSQQEAFLQKIEALQVALVTPGSVNESTGELIDYMLRECFFEKEKHRKMIVHLMYTAIQEHRKLTPENFEQEYGMRSDALEKPNARSLERLHQRLSQTIVWEEKDTLLRACEWACKNQSEKFPFLAK
jgi:hypothetical protein